MKTMWMKTAVMALTLTAIAAAHAQDYMGVIDRTSVPVSVAQATSAQAQSQGLPANLGALPSTYAEAGKTAAVPSVETNQQILAELRLIEATLEQQVHLQQIQLDRMELERQQRESTASGH